jgi:hypothetical protein
MPFNPPISVEALSPYIPISTNLKVLRCQHMPIIAMCATAHLKIASQCAIAMTQHFALNVARYAIDFTDSPTQSPL